MDKNPKMLPTPVLKIKIREKHTLNSIKSIIKKKKPEILVLEATNPRLNTRTMNLAQTLAIYDGWERINTEIITKHRGKRLGNMISIKLKSP